MKKAAPKKPASRKSVSRKPAPKKPAPKKATAKKPVVKKTAPKKTVSKKSISKKTVSKKSVAKKPISKKPIGKKSVAAKIPSATAALSAQECAQFFALLAKQRPSPKGELHYTNPYTLLVAVVLSAQATDSGVNRATQDLFPRADTPQKMLALGEAKLRDAIQTIGLYRTKARNVIALSEQLIAQHAGTVPQDHESLVALPGVGRKTANVVRNIAFGAKTIAVDTHVFRVANRTGLAQGKTPDAVEEDLLARVPKAYLRHAHHWLILHGRYTCTARTPKCGTCPVLAICRWRDKEAFS